MHDIPTHDVTRSALYGSFHIWLVCCFFFPPVNLAMPWPLSTPGGRLGAGICSHNTGQQVHPGSAGGSSKHPGHLWQVSETGRKCTRAAGLGKQLGPAPAVVEWHQTPEAHASLNGPCKLHKVLDGPAGGTTGPAVLKPAAERRNLRHTTSKPELTAQVGLHPGRSHGSSHPHGLDRRGQGCQRRLEAIRRPQRQRGEVGGRRF